MNGRELPQTIRYVRDATIQRQARHREHMRVWLPLLGRLVSISMPSALGQAARFHIRYREEYPSRRIVMTITPFVSL